MSASDDFTSWTYYKIASGQSAQAMGLAAGSIVAAPAADAGEFYVLRPAGALAHGLVNNGPALLAELVAAGDATELTEVIA